MKAFGSQDLWNSWFDIQNSRRKEVEHFPMKGAFGMASVYERQKAVLERAYNYTQSMRAVLKYDERGNAVPKRVCIHFQRGLAMSSRALNLLWQAGHSDSV